MRNLISGQIERGEFELNDIIGRINYLFGAGELSAEDREYLIAKARNKAAKDVRIDANAEIKSLWATVRKLQAKVEKLTGERQGGIYSNIWDEWQEYKQPSGYADAYLAGDRVIWNGTRYICQMDNCMWDPETYPDGWRNEGADE